MAISAAECTAQYAAFWTAQRAASGGPVVTTDVQTELPAHCGAECTTVQQALLAAL